MLEFIMSLILVTPDTLLNIFFVTVQETAVLEKLKLNVQSIVDVSVVSFA